MYHHCYALVMDGKVIQTYDITSDISFEDLFPSSVKPLLIPCSKEVAQHWDYNNGVFTKPIEQTHLTIQKAYELKIKELFSKYTLAFDEISKVYPAAEREGWPEQKAEAIAYFTNTSAPTPILTRLIEERGMGESIEEFGKKVVYNSTVWGMVYASLTGQQQRMYKEITTISHQELVTINDISSYLIEFKMPSL